MSYKDRLLKQEQNIRENPKFEDKRTTEPPPEEGIVVDADYLCLRKTPSISGNLLGFAKKGTKLKVLGTEGEYYKVIRPNPQNGIAYVSNKYLEIKH